MFWPLSAFYWQKISLFYRFTFGRGYALTFRPDEGASALGPALAGALAGALALASAGIKAHKKTAHLGRLVYILFTSLAICIISSDVARRRSLRLMPNSLAFTVTPLPDLPRDARNTFLLRLWAGVSPKPAGLACWF